MHLIPRNDKDLENPDDIFQFMDGYDKEYDSLTSFLRFYKAKIVTRNAISKQTEDNIKTDADKIYRLTTAYISKLEESTVET